MEQITVRIRHKAKAKVLLDLLTALDFVESVERVETQEESPDFFSFAGIWRDRDVDLDPIREKAWSRQI